MIGESDTKFGFNNLFCKQKMTDHPFHRKRQKKPIAIKNKPPKVNHLLTFEKGSHALNRKVNLFANRHTNLG